jgi:hypothetical protein
VVLVYHGAAFVQVGEAHDKPGEAHDKPGEAHDKPGEVVKYCRACELACPVARRNTRKSSDLGGDVI